MSSSISSSDDAAAPAWRRWLWTFALVPIAFAAICALTLVLDPYSTGRFTPITRIDLATKNDLFGHAARIRDRTFTAAMVGNSSALPFDPARLTAATGQRFAQLSALALRPDEELMIARAFIRNRRNQSPTLVMVLDHLWCETDDVHYRIRGVFPAFVFESSDLEYLKRMIFPAAVEAAGYRMLMLAGLTSDRRRRDGYAPIIFANEQSDQQIAQAATWPRPTTAPPLDAPLPALAGLQALARELDPETRLVLYFMPVPLFRIPAPGSPAAARLDHCKSRYRELANSRPHTALVDRMIDDEFARNMRNFGDSIHVHNRAAPVLERHIVDALAQMRPR